MTRKSTTLALLVVLALAAPAPPAIVSDVLAATGYEAVPEVAPAWGLRFGGNVSWQRVTPLGHLLVSTSDGLYGVDPDAGRAPWRHDHLRHLDEAEYDELRGTPFVVVSGGKVDTRVTILDAGSGRIIFDSTAAGFVRLQSEHVLVESRSLLIIGFREGDREPVMSTPAAGRSSGRSATSMVSATPRSI